MARILRLIIGLACLLAGALVGALNTQSVALDLGFRTLNSSLGLVVLVSLLLGVIVGGAILAVGVVAPLRHRLRRLEPRNRATSTDS